MTPERWTRLAEIFQGAVDQPPDTRDRWVAAACEGDDTLRRDLDALLDAHDTAGDFLEQPPVLDHEDLAAVARDASPFPAPGTAEGVVLPAGTRIGPYAIREELGRGGMGIVYLADDVRLGRAVALKALPASVAGRQELRERLRREARAAATIAHPAVAVVYALEEVGDELFIASEYVRGHTLREEIGRGPLPAPRALAIGRAIAGALAAAHDAGVVHRDLKPENVLIGDGDVVKVVDFGVAAIDVGDGMRLTRPGAAPGTPAYMAPEQLLGAEVDARADLYAFGIVLTEMLTGHHPMDGRHADDDWPEAVAAIADRCLQPAPHARFRSARQLLQALERASDAGGATGSGRTWRTSPRWWWEFHQAVAALVYWLMVIPAWSARGLIGGVPGRVFFVCTLAAVIVSANLRLHLWFTSRFYPVELRWVRARSGRFIRAGDWTFAAALIAGGLLVDDRWSAISVLLIAFGIGAAVASLFIEPVTTRAAFRTSAGPLRRA